MRSLLLLCGLMVYGLCVFSQDPTPIKVIETKKKTLRFLVFGDWGRNGEDKQREVAAEMGIVAKKFKPEFIVSTGDNFYPNGVRSTQDHNWLASFENIYKAQSLQTDWYVVLGNHDYRGNPQAEIDYSQVDRKWNMPGRYYSKIIYIDDDTSEGILLVFIDTTPLISEYYVGTQHSVRGQDTAVQRAWLEQILSEAPSNIKWKLVFGHHPVYTGGGRMTAPETVEMKNIFKKNNKTGVPGITIIIFVLVKVSCWALGQI